MHDLFAKSDCTRRKQRIKENITWNTNGKIKKKMNLILGTFISIQKLSVNEFNQKIKIWYKILYSVIKNC